MSEQIILPEIPPEEITWRNELLGTRRHIVFPAGAGDTTLQFSAAPIPATKYVHLTAGDVTWLVGFADWDQLVHVLPELGVDVISPLDDEIFVALLEAVFQSQLDWLAGRMGTACEIRDVTEGFNADDHPHDIGFQIASGTSSVSGTVAGDTAAMAMLRDLVLESPPSPGVDVSLIPLVAGVEIGMTQIAASELQQLKAGDVLMMEITTFAENQRALLRFPPTTIWKVSVDDESITFEEAVESPQPTAVGDGVTLNVVFELGRITLTAGQLATLETGASIPRINSEKVTLTSEGSAFASGQLVQVGSCTGVRIDAISSEIPEPAPTPEEIFTPPAEAEAEDSPEVSEAGEPV